jgi:hypothetical protein
MWFIMFIDFHMLNHPLQGILKVPWRPCLEMLKWGIAHLELDNSVTILVANLSWADVFDLWCLCTDDIHMQEHQTLAFLLCSIPRVFQAGVHVTCWKEHI